jgi:ketosteroid isomerase-like protein
MMGNHEHRRELLARIFRDLGRGRGASFRDGAATDVSWWLPLGTTAEHQGISQVESLLVGTLGNRRAQLQSVILSANGVSAVVEQVLSVAEGATTPATSVLGLRDGVIVSGRTYLDVADWPNAAMEVHRT